MPRETYLYHDIWYIDFRYVTLNWKVQKGKHNSLFGMMRVHNNSNIPGDLVITYERTSYQFLPQQRMQRFP